MAIGRLIDKLAMFCLKRCADQCERIMNSIQCGGGEAQLSQLSHNGQIFPYTRAFISWEEKANLLVKEHPDDELAHRLIAMDQIVCPSQL